MKRRGNIQLLPVAFEPNFEERTEILKIAQEEFGECTKLSKFYSKGEVQEKLQFLYEKGCLYEMEEE